MSGSGGEVDLLFFTHATATTGFGHAARCMRLARLISDRLPQADIAVEGEFSDAAREWLAGQASFRFTSQASAHLGVYDRMDASMEPEFWSADLLEAARARCREFVFMANGRKRPDVPAGVTVIGYKPGGPEPMPPDLLWGLEYAPVASNSVPETMPERDPGTVFIALGGAQDGRGLLKVLAAVGRLPGVTRVEVLDSPVNPVNLPADLVRTDQSLVSLRQVADLGSYLARAGMVVASYGHLGYEALACSAPLCLVGQKTFQAEYAEELEKLGLCVAAGLLSDVGEDGLANAFRQTLARAPDLGVRARTAVDGCGLDRIADLIAGRLRVAA